MTNHTATHNRIKALYQSKIKSIKTVPDTNTNTIIDTFPLAEHTWHMNNPLTKKTIPLTLTVMEHNFDTMPKISNNFKGEKLPSVVLGSVPINIQIGNELETIDVAKDESDWFIYETDLLLLKQAIVNAMLIDANYSLEKNPKQKARLTHALEQRFSCLANELIGIGKEQAGQ